jgi:hypothetical protein
VRLTGCNLLFILACVPGCVGDATIPSGGGNPDARLPSADARIAADASVDGPPAVFKCREPITTGLDNGHHNPGQDCLNGCHNHGFYMSGTLYSSAAGGAIVSGASITFVDADGYTGDMHSNMNGNFWWSLPVVFPVKITASRCPDIKPMVMTLQEADAGCNKSGCHSGGATGRIHLP